MIRGLPVGVLLGASMLAGCIVQRLPPPESESERPFQELRIGMTREQVRERLGPPESFTEHEEAWYYRPGGPQDPLFRIGFTGDRVDEMTRHVGWRLRAGSEE
jgi:hypothetical protein